MYKYCNFLSSKTTVLLVKHDIFEKKEDEK